MMTEELDKAAVAALLDDFDRLFDAGSNPIRKNLLHRLVKEVRVHSKREAEVLYRFPLPAGLGGLETAPCRVDRTQAHLAPQTGLSANRVTPWEYAVVVRLVVRMPAEAGPRLVREARPQASPLMPRICT